MLLFDIYANQHEARCPGRKGRLPTRQRNRQNVHLLRRRACTHLPRLPPSVRRSVFLPLRPPFPGLDGHHLVALIHRGHDRRSSALTTGGRRGKEAHHHHHQPHHHHHHYHHHQAPEQTDWLAGCLGINNSVVLRTHRQAELPPAFPLIKASGFDPDDAEGTTHLSWSSCFLLFSSTGAGGWLGVSSSQIFADSLSSSFHTRTYSDTLTNLSSWRGCAHPLPSEGGSASNACTSVVQVHFMSSSNVGQWLHAIYFKIFHYCN